MRSLVCTFLIGLIGIAGRAEAAPTGTIAGGQHWRLTTPKGPVHVWRPARYQARTAGIVIYVHGFYTTVDGAMTAHKLAQQFAASRRNAVFIVPEAPSGPDDSISWPDLGALLAAVTDGIGEPLPDGPLVACGHSAAHLTIVKWVNDVRITHIILIDALYAGLLEFLSWLDAMPGNELHSMVIVASGTVKWAEPFFKVVPYAVKRTGIPASVRDFTRRERAAKVLYVRTNVGHMDLVTRGKTLPVLLQRTRLKAL